MCLQAAISPRCSLAPREVRPSPIWRRCSCITHTARCAIESPYMARSNHRLTQIARLASKEWLLLLRNPHGLAVLFLMPGLFVLVMSFTLKNTLVSHIDLPLTGWVLEDSSPAAAQWAREWQTRTGG